MNKHAYLIMAHNQFDLLKMLCQAMDHPNHDFFIHIDKKSQEIIDLCEIEKNLSWSRVHYTDRLNVAWGGASMIYCELLLLKEAMNQGDYSYFHLLSGVDLPLKSAQEIYEFFERENTEFVHYVSMEDSKNLTTINRVKLFHFLQEKIGRGNKILCLIEKISLLLQRLFHVNRLKRNKYDVAKGANWFSITDELARYLTQKEEDIKKFVSYSCCADELFLQTFIKNTSFQDKLFLAEPNDDYRSIMRYIDWERGNPYIFRSSDYDDLIYSEFLFARKFDLNVDRDICEKIFQYVMERNKMYNKIDK